MAVKRAKSNKAKTFGRRKLPVIGADEVPKDFHPAVEPAKSVEDAWRWLEIFQDDQPAHLNYSR
jgi:hypothetical protein